MENDLVGRKSLTKENVQIVKPIDWSKWSNDL